MNTFRLFALLAFLGGTGSVQAATEKGSLPTGARDVTNVAKFSHTLDIPVSLLPAAVTISGPCITPPYCQAGPDTQDGKLLASVTVTPSQDASAALNVDRSLSGGTWQGGFLASENEGTHDIHVKISTEGGEIPHGPEDWWHAGEPGEPVTWQILSVARPSSYIQPGTYQLFLQGGDWVG